MDLQLNTAKPLIMHIDLNACYAMLEQQANPLIRNKPVGIAAYGTSGGFILAASYEAKRLGIGLMRVREARELCPNIIILTPDPEKYFDAHRRFRKVLLKYTDKVTPKSIDEFIVDFGGSLAVQNGQSLVDIGHQIKRDIKKALGDYVTVNVGIAPNRFLAKVAAGLNKPDGLDIITSENLERIYDGLSLVDLPGINVRYEARLNFANIYTPLQFLQAPLWTLKHQVFQSINGYYWFLRLRGYEIDDHVSSVQSFGQQYALGDKTTDKEKLSRLIMKLSEKCGRRLRKHGFIAGGVVLGVGYENRTFWGQQRKSKSAIYTTQDIYRNIMRLMSLAPTGPKVTSLDVSVNYLEPVDPIQMGLFDNTRLDSMALAGAVDKMNDRYGEFTVVPAIMANMDDLILKRVPFGSVRDL
ncbi:MAG TPA: hypothetical protein VJJ78_00825 [Candidatus Saccharimonadales bacterium]|nr:hypothetical protein [Candidatus Saccharimonadales bacterium]